MIKPGSTFDFVVALSDDGNRLDAVISAMAGCSRTFVQELIEQGAVTVDAKVAKKKSVLVNMGQHIAFTVPKLCCAESQAAPLGTIADRVILCAEEEDFIIINKPAGLVVHAPHRKSAEPSLVDWLALKGYLNGFDEADLRPGIVHRLDRDTSGIMIIAKNRLAHAALADLFRNRKIQKKYYGLVEGNCLDQIHIDSFLIRDPISHVKMATVPYSYHTAAGRAASALKRAVTDIKKIKQFCNFSLIEVTPTTGRTHQIRVHCASIGNPIVGDTVYGSRSERIARHALHAFSLAFEYQGKQYLYQVPIPSDIAQLI